MADIEAFGADFREVDERTRMGNPVRVVRAERVYMTGQTDLWDALTNIERIRRWFSPVSGELHLGGRYQIEGNAGGTITRCDEPEALDVTWNSETI
ncbi:MAG: SRPBCC domain-containing protein [Pseudomonadota bacterium]